MQVQPQDFLTAVWANCYEKLGDVLKMKADEARRFVALISDPPPARIIERLPRVTLESLTASSSSSTSSSSSSSSFSSEDATEGGPDLGNEILDYYRANSSSSHTNHKRSETHRKRSEEDQKMSLEHKFKPMKKRRIRSSSASPVRPKAKSRSRRHKSPPGTVDSSDDDIDNDIIEGCEHVRSRVVEKIKKGPVRRHHGLHASPRRRRH